jgi:hypothetical protein
MQVKRSSTLPETGTALDWRRLESEVADLSDLAAAVRAFGPKVPPGAVTVWHWQQLSTPALVALAQAGHREAFDPLYRRYSGRVLAYATSRQTNAQLERSRGVAHSTDDPRRGVAGAVVGSAPGG